MNDRVSVEVHLGPDEVAEALRRDVISGLSRVPKSIPPKWFYDEAGSVLFDEITRLPEYYPTRCETSILRDHADEIAQISGAEALVELGSGTSDKTRYLLDAIGERLSDIVLLDVSEMTLRDAADRLADAYPRSHVTALVADFEEHMPHIPQVGRRLVAFLGGTIGNFRPDERSAFLAALRSEMKDGDHFLLGTDLVKSRERLERAYDDAAGVTAAFNKNVLSVINRELDADFNSEAFDHVARYDSENEWIEMHLASKSDQTVQVNGADLAISLTRGEEILTEVSAKFTVERVESELTASGFAARGWWSDADGDFAVSLWETS